MLSTELLNRVASAIGSGRNKTIGEFRVAVGLTSPEYQALKRDVKELAESGGENSETFTKLLELFPQRGQSSFFGEFPEDAIGASLDSLVAAMPTVARFVDAIAKTPEAQRKAPILARKLGIDESAFRKLRAEFNSFAPVANAELKTRYNVKRGRTKTVAAPIETQSVDALKAAIAKQTVVAPAAAPKTTTKK